MSTLYYAYAPLRQRFILGNSTYDNKYLQYTVSIGYCDPDATAITSWKNIYHGKTLVLNGETEIELTKIFQDYAHRAEFKYEIETQYFQPTNLHSLNDTLVPIEYASNSFYNTVLRITITYNNVAVLPPKDLSVSIYRLTDIANPYDDDATYSLEMYQSEIENHIPHMLTDNYYIGFDFASNANNVLPYVYGGSTDGATLPIYSRGNFATTYTLNDWFGNLEGEGATINVYYGNNGTNFFYGGSATNVNDTIAAIVGADLPSEGTGHWNNQDWVFLGYSIDSAVTRSGNQIAKVDDCYPRWYMAWWDTQWHSVALQKVSKTRNTNNFDIVNVYSEKKNIWTDVANTFTVTTQRLTNELLEPYSNILHSPYVLLFDTESDKAYWCVTSTDSINVTKANGYKVMEIELEEVITDRR